MLSTFGILDKKPRSSRESSREKTRFPDKLSRQLCTSVETNQETRVRVIADLKGGGMIESLADMTNLKSEELFSSSASQLSDKAGLANPGLSNQKNRLADGDSTRNLHKVVQS